MSIEANSRASRRRSVAIAWLRTSAEPPKTASSTSDREAEPSSIWPNTWTATFWNAGSARPKFAQTIGTASDSVICARACSASPRRDRDLALEGRSMAFQDRLPVLVGLLLLLRPGPGGGQQLGLDPVPARLLEAQVPPRRLAPRVELDHPLEMCGRLRLQTVLVAPRGQLEMGVRGLGCPGPTLEVLLHQRLVLRVVLGLAADVVGALPLAVIGDEPHEPPRQGVGGIIQDGRRQVLHPLGGHPVLLAPEGQPDVGAGVVTRLARGRLIGGPLGGSLGGRRRRVIRDQTEAEQDDREHGNGSSVLGVQRPSMDLVRVGLPAVASASGATASNGSGTGLIVLLSCASTADVPTK